MEKWREFAKVSSVRLYDGAFVKLFGCDIAA